MYKCTKFYSPNGHLAGPKLPYGIQDSAMVPTPTGGVYLIGGVADDGPLDTIFYLRNAGSPWTMLGMDFINRCRP
jgi:hypothetical protein